MTAGSIVIVTTGQPSTNPRMVKEYLALKQAGYSVKVIYSFWAGWAIETDRLFFERKDVDSADFVLAGGDPYVNKSEYFLSRGITKASGILAKLMPALFTRFAYSRTAFYLKQYAKKYPADLYIAHNLGALPATAIAANSNRSQYAFDVEDYHRGETNDVREGNKVKLIEDAYVPGTKYISAASPLILKKMVAHYPGINTLLINNVFSLQQQPPFKQLPVNADEPLKLFWFSQTVGLDRGLQNVIKAINLIQQFPIQLTLLGSASQAVKDELISILNNGKHTIIFKEPMPQEALIQECAKHHIGLAPELSETVNRDICLTNKLFTYLLAGNAIIASDTSAQKDFISTYPTVGALYNNGNVAQLSNVLIDMHLHPDQLNGMREQAYKLAKYKLNWEIEQTGLLDVINKICKKGS